jgi:short-subunit dehydrogenase
MRPARIGFKFIEAEEAARLILKGMLRNKEKIVFPLHARLLSSFYHFFPKIFGIIGRKDARALRAMRNTDLGISGELKM